MNKNNSERADESTAASSWSALSASITRATSDAVAATTTTATNTAAKFKWIFANDRRTFFKLPLAVTILAITAITLEEEILVALTTSFYLIHPFTLLEAGLGLIAALTAKPWAAYYYERIFIIFGFLRLFLLILMLPALFRVDASFASVAVWCNLAVDVFLRALVVSAVRSFCAVVQAGGTGWEKKNAQDYLGETAENQPLNP